MIQLFGSPIKVFETAIGTRGDLIRDLGHGTNLVGSLDEGLVDMGESLRDLGIDVGEDLLQTTFGVVTVAIKLLHSIRDLLNSDLVGTHLTRMLLNGLLTRLKSKSEANGMASLWIRFRFISSVVPVSATFILVIMKGSRSYTSGSA